MLWDASVLDGYVVEARDGRIGRVRDILFDDTDWVVRWLIVDTGNWLGRRDVLLPISALGEPDPSQHHFPVKLTMREVRDSPDIETDRPVSRQHEAGIYQYYGWNPYWDSGFSPVVGELAMPFTAPPPFRELAPRDVAAGDQDDPHLRSIKAVTGYHVHATDGEIGHIEDFLLEEDDWGIRYLKVDTRNWWPGNRVLISPYSVRSIDWVNRSVRLDANRTKVKNSPPYDPCMTVDGAYEESFLTYWGIKWIRS